MRIIKNMLSIFLILLILLNMSVLFTSANEIGYDMKGHWAYDYAQRLMKLGIMNGYEDGTFRLDGVITRAEFTKLLVTMRYGNYQSYEEKIFDDVPIDAWYYNVVCTANEEGILEEKPGELFRPSDLITREEMVVMITRSLGLSGGIAGFKDINGNSSHYSEICAAVKNGIINGYEDNTFRPRNTATRGETSAMVCRMLTYITDSELVSEPSPDVELTEDEEKIYENENADEPPVNNEPSLPHQNSGVDGKINLTWHQIYNTGITKTGNHMQGLNVISPTWFKIIDNTGLTPYSYERPFYQELNLYLADLGNSEYIKDCKAEGYKVWAMFGSEGVCSKTSKFLNSEKARHACVELMRELIIKYELDGINLDFENMYQKDRDKYTLFVKEMAEMCHSINVVLSVDITKYDPTSSTYSMCYDRTAIAKYADYVALMAYDQNGTWSKTAGSVSDLKWTEDALLKTLKEVPAEKLLLGIPFYTRIWETVDNVAVRKPAVGMSTVNQKIKENNARTVYDDKTGQNYAEWTVGSSVFKVWMEDKTSIKARLDLVKKYDLAGVASWSKSFETPDIWPYIEELLK